MNINIRPALESDFPAILELIKGLARFEKAEDQVTNSVELMKQEQDYFECLVAENSEGHIIGIALYFFCYYTWVGKSLYLDDLYVLPELRGQGIGRKLLDKVFLIAKQENCKRMRWQVLDWNVDAIKFYESLGAEISKEWLNCSVDHRQIVQFDLPD